MSQIFYGCSLLASLDLSGFDTSNVTNMGSMFYNCSSLSSLNLSNFEISNVTNTTQMFSSCSSTSQACRVTCTQDLKDFLLGKTGSTGMNTNWFIWEDATNNGTETFSIVGTWKMTEGDMDEWTIIFREDGTGKDSWVDEGYQGENEITYSLDWENRKLYTQVVGEEETSTWEIVAYSDTEVTLRYSFDGGTAEYVFQKVS
jgi:surface protein